MATSAAGVPSLVEQLEKLHVDLPLARADLEPVINSCLASALVDKGLPAQNLQRAFETISTSEDLYEVLKDVAHLLSISALPRQEWIASPWELLADLTKKNPLWRQVFGPLRRIRRDHTLNRSLGDPNGCILKAAVHLIQQGSVGSAPASAIRPVLRLIANCCADNNVNRSLVINSSGLEALQSLIINHTDVDILDVLLPTLYNVSTDFDEPALNESGQPYRLTSQLAEAGIEDEHLTTAEAKLQIWKLMELDDKFLESDSGPILADLIEMSSRAALFDISIIMRDYNIAETEDFNQRAGLLSHKILQQGSKIAHTSTEAQASICQTCLNLYSQPIMQTALAQSSKDVELFMEIPYLTSSVDQDEEEIDLSPYRESFLKQLYAVSALPEYQTLASSDSELLTTLAKHLRRYEILGGLGDDADSLVDRGQTSPDSVSSLSSVLALLNNALCDLEQIEAFLSQNHHHHDRGSVCKSLMLILLHENAQAVLLPALNLVNRLALTRIGAETVYEVDSHFLVMSRLLKHESALKPSLGQSGRREVSPIQREIVTLARLLIKSSPSIALALAQNAVYHDQILTSSSADIGNQPELARLNIGFLRIIAAGDRAAAAEKSTALLAATITDAANLPLLTASLVSFLLLAGSSSSGGDSSGNNSNISNSSEPLFGLALFASLFINPSSAYHNPSVKPALLSRLAEDREEVVNMLGDVVANAALSSTTATTTSTTAAEEPKPNLINKPRPDIENLQVLLTHLYTATTRSGISTGSTSNDGNTAAVTSLLNDLGAIASSIGLQD